MSKDLKSSQQSEEVDLGQLFKLIGNVFDRFFRFISKIFKALYNLVLSVLIHFHKRLFWYVGVVVFGLILGFFMDKNSDKEYGANMFIETNFRSARQVYENIKDLHQLAAVDKDTMELAKRLNITPTEASKLNGFYIQPDIDENNIVEMYSRYYGKLDSISRLEMNYEKYKNSLTPYNFGVHLVGVGSKDKFLYNKIESAFVEYLSHNEYLEEVLKVNTENLKRKDQTLLVQMQKTDSLANEYLKIRINESKKEPIPGGGTNLYMGGSKGESSNLIIDESEVIQRRLVLEQQRRDVFKNLAEQKSVVNILSGFPNSGYDIRKWKEHKTFVFPLVFLSFPLVLFILIGLRKFLDKQVKNDY